MYKKLYDLSSKIDKNVKGDISYGLKSVLVDGETMLSMLKKNEYDVDKIMEVASVIADKGKGRKPKIKMSKESQRVTSRSFAKIG